MELRYDPVVVFYLGDGDNVLLVEMVICRSTLKEYGKSGELTPAMVRLILTEEKPKERKVTIKGDKISRYFPEDYSNDDIEGVILELLEEWQRKQ